MNAATLESIKKSAAVPSMPQVVVRFLEVIQDPYFEHDELVKTLSTDAGTVSEVLRLANSALFGVRQKITSLKQALTLLGPKRTRSLVLGRYLVGTMGRRHCDSLDMSYFWRRSLASAVVAARCADTVAPRLRDDVFIAALLADIGVPILAEAMPDAYGIIAERYGPSSPDFCEDDERDAVGVTHAEISAMVLTYWSLPDLVSRAVNLQHSPSVAVDGGSGTIARLINASDRIARILCEVPDVDHAARVCVEAAGFMGVEITTLIDLLGLIEADIEELASILRIDVIPSNVYTLIARAVRERLTTVGV